MILWGVDPGSAIACAYHGRHTKTKKLCVSVWERKRRKKSMKVKDESHVLEESFFIDTFSNTSGWQLLYE